MAEDALMAEVDQRTNLAYSNEMEMLTFYLTDEQLYGINVFKIIEIMECPKVITKMPYSHPVIKGSIDFRGHPISLFDLADGMGLEPLDYKNSISYVLVCEYSNTVQGFLVSRPNMLINKSWGDIIKPEGSVYDSSFLTAITYHNDQPIQILDVEKVLSDVVGIATAVSGGLLKEFEALPLNEHSILAVDDSKAACQLIESALDQIGVQHKVVTSAHEALNILTQSLEENGGLCPFTLIFTDLEMPGMDGFTFTRKVRENPALSKVYLAVHSSLSNRSNKEKAQQMGADDFIPKFVPDRIVGAILEQIKKVDSQRAAA